MDALRGILLVWQTPRLWPLCLGPLLGAVFAYAALGVLGGVLLLPHFMDWLEKMPGGDWWSRLAGIGAIVVWILLFPLLFTLLGGAFFGLVLEPLSLAVEQTVRHRETLPHHKLRFGESLTDTLSRLFLNASLGLAALLLGFAFGPIPGILAASIVGLLDYSSPAYLRRGYRLPSQMRRLLTRPDRNIVSFGLIAGLLSLIPVIGVLLMPGLIAGGTLLTLRREGHDPV